MFIKNEGSFVLQDMTLDEFFKRQPVLLPLFLALKDAAQEKFSDLRIRIQEHQLTFFDIYPYCKVTLPSQSDIKVEDRNSLVLSFELPMECISNRFAKIITLAKDKFLHYVVINSSEQLDEELISWLEMSREWNNLYACR